MTLDTRSTTYTAHPTPDNQNPYSEKQNDQEKLQQIPPLENFTLEAIADYLEAHTAIVIDPKETSNTRTFFIRIDRDDLTLEECQNLVIAFEQHSSIPPITRTSNEPQEQIEEQAFISATNLVKIKVYVKAVELKTKLKQILQSWRLPELVQIVEFTDESFSEVK